MREFGVYKLSDEFRRKYNRIVNKKLTKLKIPDRPFVCVKLGVQNWLIPLSSINPIDDKYDRILKKRIEFERIDNENKPKAMKIFGDLLNKGVEGYKSVAMYYSAIPAKHQYCCKYRDATGGHVIVSTKAGTTMRGQLINYLQKVKEGKLTGFIKALVEKGEKKLESYPINCYDLHNELYKTHNEIKATHENRTKQIEEHKQTQQYQKDLKNLYLERGEYAAYEDLSSATQSDLSGYVGKESAGVVDKETQQDLHTTQNKNQPQQVRQVGQVEQVELVRQVGQAQKSQNNVKQKAKTPNSAGKR